jgi:hypothetical protein
MVSFFILAVTIFALLWDRTKMELVITCMYMDGKGIRVEILSQDAIRFKS